MRFSRCIEHSFIEVSPIQWIILIYGLYVGKRSFNARRQISTTSSLFPAPDTVLGFTCIARSIYALSLLHLYYEPATYPPYIVYGACVLFAQSLHTAVLAGTTRGYRTWMHLRALFAIDFMLQLCFISYIDWDSKWATFDFILQVLQNTLPFIASLRFIIAKNEADEVWKSSDGWDNNWLSRLTFFWIWPLLHHGYRSGRVDQHDLPPLRVDDRPEDLLEHFNALDVNLPLYKKLYQVCRKTFWQSAGLLFVSTVAGLGIPLILHRLLDFVSSIEATKSASYGYGLAGALFLTMTVKSATEHQFWMIGTRCSTQMRSILCLAVFEKSLRLSTKARTQFSMGKIQNLIAVDSCRIGDRCVVATLHWGTWAALLSIIVSLYAISSLLSIRACLVWVAVTALYIPIGTILSRKVKEFGLETQVKRDARAESTRFGINMLLSLRLFRWDSWAAEIVQADRQEELGMIERRKKMDGLNSILLQTSQLVAPVASLLTYAWIYGHEHLDAATAFSALAWFSTCSVPIGRLPRVVSNISDIINSLERIEEFLKATERGPSRGIQYRLDGTLITEITRASWTATDEPILRNINLRMDPDELLVVDGAVASGKTSLVHMLMGNLITEAGTHDLYTDIPSIAYCAEEPWLQNTTIRDNILFGNAYSSERFNQVVYCCGLQQDLEEFAEGDMKIVGDDGKRLSGGQRQRVSIARAAYSNCKYVFFDNVLCSVDQSVRDHILKECVFGWLKDRTRLITIHKRDFGGSDLILRMSNRHLSISSSGEMVEHTATGSYETGEATAPEQMAKTGTSDQSQISDEKCTGQLRIRDVVEYWRNFGACTSFRVGILVFFVSQPVLHVAGAHFLSSWCSTQSDASHRMMLLYAGLSLAECCVIGVRIILYISGSINASMAIHRKLLLSVFSVAPMSFLDSVETGDLMNRFLSDISYLDENVPSILAATLKYMLSLASSIVAVLYSTPSTVGMAVLFICISFPYVMLYQYYRWPARDLKRMDSALRAPMLCFIDQSLSGVDTIKAFGARAIRFQMYRMNEMVTRSATTYWISWVANQWITTLLEVLGNFVVLGCGLLGVWHASNVGRGHSGALGMALLFASQIPSQIGWMIKNLASCEIECICLERIERVRREAKDALRLFHLKNQSDPRAVIETETINPGTISIRNLTVRYDNSPDVLKDISINIAGGTKIAVVGRTGSGKSSLMHVMLGIYPFQGKIRIDGQDIRNRRDQSVGVIPQTPQLFGKTLRDGILGPKQSYEHEKSAWDILSRLDMHERISQLRLGMDTALDEIKRLLSAGEIQLLCITRTLIQKESFTVLFCDEITSNLDVEKERLVHDLLLSLDATVLFICHKLAFLRQCDAVIVMQAGEIVEFKKPNQVSSLDV